MKRRDGDENEQDSAGWLTTYSDMVTLLFTFFVLMFAISNVDAMKFQLLAMGLSRDGITAEQFLEIQKQHGIIFEREGDPDPDIENKYPGVDSSEIEDSADPENPPAPPEETEETEKIEDKGDLSSHLDILYEMIFEYIKQNKLEDSIELIHEGDKLLLRLTSDIWFSPGSADITGKMRENAAVLAKLLSDTQNKDNPFEIIVGGHTDNVPQHSPQYPSNWHLSVNRAVNFLEILLFESGLPSNSFSARGYGEEEPIANNGTPEGREKNRRVEVLISHLKGIE